MAYDPTFGKGAKTGAAATAPVSTYDPTFGKTATPAATPGASSGSTPAYFQGDGYGPSSIKDPYSGKPLLWQENPAARSTQLLTDKTDLTFDFTKPQVISRDMLTNKPATGPSHSEQISSYFRKELGATAYEQLDHIMPIELGGSNDKSNLRLEPLKPGTKNTATDPVENHITQMALQGNISVKDAWHMMAVAKGIVIPGAAPAQSFFDKMMTALGSAAGYIAEHNPIVQTAAAIQSKGVVGGLKDVASRALNDLTVNSPRYTKGLGFNPGNSTNMAIGGLSAPEDVVNILAKSTNLGEVTSLLKNMAGVTDENLPSLAEQIVKAKTPEAVKSILSGEAPRPPAGYDPTFAPKPKTTVIQTDEAAQQTAAGRTIANPKASGVAALDKPTAKAYRDWVNFGSHNSQALSGRIAANQFEDLRAAGMDAVHAIQQGGVLDGGRFSAVKNFFADLLTKEQKAGIPVEERANYIPQYWANSDAEIQKAYEQYAGQTAGKTVTLHPGFTKEATFPDYATGEAYGLTPKYNNLPDIINARVRASEKALADRSFYDYLAKHNLIQPSNEVGSGWKELRSGFPKYSFTTGDGKVYNGSVSAPAPLAELINNQLSVPEGIFNRGLNATANFASKLKNVVLSAGVPGTAINMHGFNELAATVPEVLTQPSLFTSALQYIFYPKAAGNFVQANLAHALEASRDGLTITAEDHAFDELGRLNVMNGLKDKAGAVLTKATQTLYGLFGKHDFEEMIPALKLKMWSDLKGTLTAEGLSETDAGRMAAEKANNVFGGQNYAALGRDKNLQNFLRAVVFAPDFWESRLKYAGSMAKSLASNSDPLASTYRKAVATIAGAYIGMNLWNKQTLGRYMFQNPAGHEMDIFIGHDSQGKDVWLRPFGTALDFVRLPLDIARSAQEGDLSPVTALFRNRVSTILQPIVSLVANVDAYGNPIFGADKYGKPQSIPQQLGHFASTLPVVPQVVSGAAALTDPTKSKAQDISQALSLPVKFNAPATSKDVVKLKADAAQAVRDGNYGPLDDLIKNGVITKKGRAAFIKTAKLSPEAQQKKKDQASQRSQSQRTGAGDIMGL